MLFFSLLTESASTASEEALRAFSTAFDDHRGHEDDREVALRRRVEEVVDGEAQEKQQR